MPAKNRDAHAAESVSYTHLDVYKRQLHVRFLCVMFRDDAVRRATL